MIISKEASEQILMKSRVLALLVMVGLVIGFVSPVVATTYYGPSFSTPVSIAPGGTINIVLTTGSGSAAVPLPQGSSTPCSGTCTYPNDYWTNATVGGIGNCFYSIHEVTVTDPDGNEFMLGSAVTSGLYWSAALGGGGSGTHYPPQAAALNVTNTDYFTIPFATGAGGFSFTSVLPNPPNPVTAGPYYWWTVAGSVYGANIRLDQNLTINPTLIQGTYVVDIEGNIVCPTGAVTPFSSYLFFDSGIVVTTPQFPIGSAVVAATGLAALLLVRKRIAIPSKA